MKPHESPPQTRRPVLVSHAGCILGVVLLLLGACSQTDGADGSKAQAQMCATANEYLWHTQQFGQSPPSRERAEEALNRLIELSTALVKQVPDDRREQARSAPEGWSEVNELYATYDYGQNGELPSGFLDEMRTTLNDYRHVSNRYVQWLTDQCAAPDEGQWPTPLPEQ